MRIRELDTPALLVDVGRLQRNIDRMAGDMRRAGVALRPHVKTSKMREVIRRQRLAGARAFTCSTRRELQILLDEEIESILWAYQPVGQPKIDALIEASRRSEVLVALDSHEAASQLGRAAVQAETTLPFLLEIDTGLERTGVPPVDALAAARALASIDGLRLTGVMTHEGHVAMLDSPAAVDRAAREAAEAVVKVGAELGELGIRDPIVSVGSTAGARAAPFVEGVTEARPGTYVFYDSNQSTIGSAGWDDCAVTVIARVVSRPGVNKAIVEAGLKAMSSDRPIDGDSYGHVIGLDATFPTAYEEHGVLVGPGANSLTVGNLVRIIPNHVCGTVNMWSQTVAVDGDEVVGEWEIGGRY